jgi:pimeloyl-ACP methyl ester carboxylesterase
MRVITRIKKETGQMINPREFIFQSLGQIAAICEGKKIDNRGKTQVPTEIRESFFFGEDKKRLFGCCHKPRSNKFRDCNIVLCYPIGQEYIRAHRTFVQLGARLSAVGFPVLRFDYYGCGDSEGNFGEASITRWMEDISSAVNEMRDRTHIEKVCLLGLRLGGSLSMMYASKDDGIDGLILWNPIVSGRNHIRELNILHKETLKNTYTSKPRKKNNNTKEFLGYSFLDSLLSGIGQIDLLSAKPAHDNKTLFIQSGQMEDGDKMRAFLRECSPHLMEKELPGPNVWLEDPYQEIVQQSVVQLVASWLSEEYK